MKQHIYLLIIFIVIPIVRMFRSQIISRFIYTHTTSPTEAKQLKDIGLANLLLLKVLIYRGVIKETDGNKYYLDLDRNYELENDKVKYIIGFVILVLAAIAIVYFSVNK